MRAMMVIAGMTLVSGVAVAAPLDTFGGSLDEGAMAVTPGLFVSADGTMAPNTYFAGGLGSKGDWNLGIGTEFTGEGLQGGFIHIMPRAFITPGLGLAPCLILDGDTVSVGAEIHNNAQVGAFIFTSNVGWRADATSSEFSPGAIYASLAPEVAIGDRFTTFVEFNPGLPIADPAAFELTVVPGFSAVLDREGNHSIALGVRVPVSSAPSPTVGAWYSFGFAAPSRASGIVADAASEESHSSTLAVKDAVAP